MDKNNQYHRNGNGFGNGFVLGLIVGAAAVFLLFTKKGKHLLKVISEEGIEGIDEFKELLNYDTEEEEYEDAPQSRVLEKTGQVAAHVGKTAKRFFHGVRKRA